MNQTFSHALSQRKFTGLQLCRIEAKYGYGINIGHTTATSFELFTAKRGPQALLLLC